MNCLEFRRRCTVDPRDIDSAMSAHRMACRPCAELVSSIEDFEAKLAAALRVEVPEGLESRILLNCSLRERRSRRRWQLGGVAMAASLLVAVGVMTWALLVQRAAAPTLEQWVFQHIEEEPAALRASQDVKEEYVRSLFEQFGGDLGGSLGRVTYSGKCPVRKGDGIHLVLRGERGPVTVLILPGDYVEQREVIQSAELQGEIVEIPWGSMAIVGEPGEAVGPIEERIRANVKWL